ncbi:distal tail protein Dit [Shouchella lehensis]|uniref:Phage tail component n=1 Tax=Shouchella lehensis G1 TaxID=1246626 RepID=A0A060LVN0_9BACI|nr:distal tail protein Dit [Shouchella lehensis]AIC93835.1 phage tail component [Shouchella lehensis G1]
MQFTFNGIRKKYITVLSHLQRPVLPSISYTTTERVEAGERVTGMKMDSIILDVPVVIYHRDKTMQELKLELSSWLYSEDEQKLVFSDTPSQFYLARFLSVELEEYEHFSKGIIQFLCPTPYQYAGEIVVPITEQQRDIHVVGQVPVFWTLHARIDTRTSQFEIRNQHGEKLILQHQFLENDVIEIDAGKRAIYLNRDARMSLLSFESRWFPLRPGVNILSVSAPSTITYQNIYF